LHAQVQANKVNNEQLLLTVFRSVERGFWDSP